MVHCAASMLNAAHRFDRLSRDDLTSPAYRELASRLFGAESFDAHVRYCRWLFDENPAHPADEPLPLYVCREDEQLIAQFGLVPVFVYLEGTPLRAVWGVDFHVLPEHQRRGIGEQFLARWQLDYPLLLSLGQSAAGYAWNLKYRYREVGALMQCKQWLRPVRCALKMGLQLAGLQSAARTLIRVPAPSTAPASPGIQVESMASFANVPGESRDLRGPINRHSRTYRSPAFMEWRYCRHPLFRYAVRRLLVEEYGEAYAVCRLIDDGGLRRGSLVDLVYPNEWPQNVVERVITVTRDCVCAEGADVFQCETSDPAVIAAFREQRFARVERGARLLYRARDGHDLSVAPVEQWRLFGGDSDVDTHTARRVRS